MTNRSVQPKQAAEKRLYRALGLFAAGYLGATVLFVLYHLRHTTGDLQKAWFFAALVLLAVFSWPWQRSFRRYVAAWCPLAEDRLFPRFERPLLPLLQPKYVRTVFNEFFDGVENIDDVRKLERAYDRLVIGVAGSSFLVMLALLAFVPS